MSKELIATDKWLQRTSVFGRVRSFELKQIDEALKAYNQNPSDAGLKKVRVALAAWKAKEGAAWKISKRNASNAVTDLDKRLAAIRADPKAGSSWEEVKARLKGQS